MALRFGDSLDGGLACRIRESRPAIDQNAMPVAVHAVLDPKAVTMPGRQHLDREHGLSLESAPRDRPRPHRTRAAKEPPHRRVAERIGPIDDAALLLVRE